MNNTSSGLAQKGFVEAKKITKKFSKTFYYASNLLPKDKRNAAYAIYEVCRKCDDSVDDPGENPAEVNLKEMRGKIEAAYKNDPIDEGYLMAFRETVTAYKIPIDYFYDLIDGMNMDLIKKRYQNFNELYEYCYKVAGVVGLIMVKIFGYNDENALGHAVELGVAMQLTNILRDIKEDLSMGRIYLPKNEMEKYNINEGMLSSAVVNDDFKDFMVFQIKRAREYYEKSSLGIKMIANTKYRWGVLTMKNLYSYILNIIEKNNYDVFKKRARVSFLRKMFIRLKTMFKAEYME